MQQNYSDKIKDHYRNPRNFGKLINADLIIEKLNSLCGDETKIYLKIKNGIIKIIAHETRGCMIAVASASVVSEYALDKNISEIKKLKTAKIAKMLGVTISPARASCGMLFVEALQNK